MELDIILTRNKLKSDFFRDIGEYLIKVTEAFLRHIKMKLSASVELGH